MIVALALVGCILCKDGDASRDHDAHLKLGWTELGPTRLLKNQSHLVFSFFFQFVLWTSSMLDFNDCDPCDKLIQVVRGVHRTAPVPRPGIHRGVPSSPNPHDGRCDDSGLFAVKKS